MFELCMRILLVGRITFVHIINIRYDFLKRNIAVVKVKNQNKYIIKVIEKNNESLSELLFNFSIIKMKKSLVQIVRRPVFHHFRPFTNYVYTKRFKSRVELPQPTSDRNVVDVSGKYQTKREDLCSYIWRHFLLVFAHQLCEIDSKSWQKAVTTI